MNKYEGKSVSIKRPLLLTLLAATFALGVFAGAGMGLYNSPTASRSEAVPALTGKSSGLSAPPWNRIAPG